METADDYSAKADTDVPTNGGPGRVTMAQPDPSAPALPASWLPAPEAQVPYTLRVLAGYAWRLSVILLALWLLGQIVGAITSVLIALFVGGVFAALLGPLVNLLSRVLPRGLAVGLGFLLSVIAILAILTFVTVEFINQVPQLTAQISEGLASLQDWLKTGPLKIDNQQLADWVKTAQSWFTSNAGNFASGILGGLGTVGELLTGLALAVFAAVFFLYDGAGIWSWLVGTTPRRAQVRVRTSGELAWQTFSAYARGTVIIALTNAILVGIALMILRVPLPIPLALLVFFGAFIPYVGSPIAMVVAALVALAANGPWSFVAVIVLIAIIGQLEGNILQPLIMSKQVSLHPLVVIISVIGGSAAIGLIGAVIAVPVVSVIWIIVRYLTGRDPSHPRPPAFTIEPVHRVTGDTW